MLMHESEWSFTQIKDLHSEYGGLRQKDSIACDEKKFPRRWLQDSIAPQKNAQLCKKRSD